MKKNKVILLTVLICISLLAGITTLFLIRNSAGLQKPPVIAFYKLNPEYYPVILEFLEDEITGFGRKCNIIELNSNVPLPEQLETIASIDLLFAADGLGVESAVSMLRPLIEEPAKLLPASTRLRGLLNNKRYAYPLELDHVEIAFRKDLFAGAGFSVGERILSLAELEGALSTLAGKNFFPLMIAGAEDENLLDAVTVLSLSLGGSQAVTALAGRIKNNETFTSILNAQLAVDLTFADVLKKLGAWKKMGILHPEWLKFSPGEVLSFVEDELTAAVILRLSAHRHYPFAVIKKYSESPFPFAGRNNSAAGIIAPLHIASQVNTGLYEEQAAKILATLVQVEFQNALSHFTGLAPASATAETMDKQAADLRFWGAASRKVMESLVSSAFAADSEQKAFAAEIRQYLGRL